MSVQVSLPGDTLYAEKTCDTFEDAVLQCIESLDRPLEKYKEKRR